MQPNRHTRIAIRRFASSSSPHSLDSFYLNAGMVIASHHFARYVRE
jgi:hypothetical protein